VALEARREREVVEQLHHRFGPPPGRELIEWPVAATAVSRIGSPDPTEEG